MAGGDHVTVVEAALARGRWRMRLALLLLGLIFLVGAGALIAGGILYMRYGRGESAPVLASEVDHFQYGSIGSEVSSGIPYWAWQAMPRLFPEEFQGRDDYSAFGFLYERDTEGKTRDLPIGLSTRRYRGVDMVWFNCAVCHSGTWRPDAATPPRIVAGMPANNLDFSGFVRFLLERAAPDSRMAPARLVAAAEEAGASFGRVERQIWLNLVGPQLREGLIERRNLLMPLLATQADWGPGRVDTFNPYKLIQMRMSLAQLSEGERVGPSDFPSIFLQRPREGMHLHWDGNNRSLSERNLSAAIGAGVTPDTAQIPAIQRVADWLMDLAPPPSPHRPDAGAVGRGRAVYMEACAACHGWQSERAYVFEGVHLGRVAPIGLVGTDRGRLDSYTQEFRDRQIKDIFEGTPYRFRFFTKTDGYANQPLDGLWLRGPYLHNGSVPSLAALFDPPALRPRAFIRGYDIVDGRRGGFLSPPCDPAAPPAGRGAVGQRLTCYDTAQRGNGNGGHLWGTELPPALKADLLAYLLTF